MQIEISKNLYIGAIPCNREEEEVRTVTQMQHIIYCVDISGSMYNELAELRRHLKNHLVSDNIHENTAISIIAFSGKNECFTVVESVKLNDLRDIDRIHKAIDKYLQALCLTAFLPPLQVTEQVIENYNKANPNEEVLHSLVFMTDGYNNDSPYSEVLKKLEQLDSKVASASFIEYGYYADGKSLLEMAEAVGGQKIFAKDFESYQIEFDKILDQKAEERVSIDIDEIKSSLAFPFLFAKDGNRIIMYSTKYKKEILVSKSVKEVYYFSKLPIEINPQIFEDSEDAILYLAAYVLSMQNKYFDAEKCIAKIGDIFFLKLLQGSYGKQKLNQFQELLRDAVHGQNRLVEGRDKTYVPDDNQYCLMNLINDLSSSEENRFLPDNPSFEYNYTGVKMETVGVEIGEGDRVVPEFKRKYSANGYPLTDLVYNSERANISIRLRIDGDVVLPKNQFGVDSIPSFIWRNYTIVRDGILNFRYLPCILNEKTYNKLVKKGVKFIKEKVETTEDGRLLQTVIIDMSDLPIINKRMVKSISAKSLAEIEIELIKVQSAAKFLKSVLKTTPQGEVKISPFAKVIQGQTKEFLEYVTALGISEYNGFSPKVAAADSTDSYMSCCLKTKVAKFSSVPKVADVIKKINENKNLTPSESVVKDEMDKFYNVSESVKYEGMSEKSKQKIAEDIAENYFVDNNEKRKELIAAKAEIIFSLIMTRSWFKEFSSMDENEIEVNVNNDIKTTCKFEFKEEEVAI